SNVLRSRRTVNHVGPSGFMNATTYAAGVVSRRNAFVKWPAQIGSGCGVGVCADWNHLPFAARYQRRAPMTIPEAPPRIWYSSLSGRSRVKSDTTLLRGLEASRSMYSTLRSARNVRVAFATSADAGFGCAGIAKRSLSLFTVTVAVRRS